MGLKVGNLVKSVSIVILLALLNPFINFFIWSQLEEPKKSFLDFFAGDVDVLRESLGGVWGQSTDLQKSDGCWGLVLDDLGFLYTTRLIESNFYSRVLWCVFQCSSTTSQFGEKCKHGDHLLV